jgi:HAD superfamily hydrolase (TIGR01484 family)
MKNSQRIILASDIDNTQYACERPELDSDSQKLQSYLQEFRSQGNILVHNTARRYPWIGDGCAEKYVERFIHPIIADADYIIHSSGTGIYDVAKQKENSDWRRHVESTCSESDIQLLRSQLSRTGLSLHGESNHTPYKTSFVASPKEKADYVKIVEKIVQTQFRGAFELTSWNPTDIEITPLGINKKTALDFCLSSNNLTDNKVVVAGDNYNDLAVLDDSRRLQIVVGNAPDEIKNYIAGKHNQAFIAAPNQPVASGVIAGLKHFGLI